MIQYLAACSANAFYTEKLTYLVWPKSVLLRDLFNELYYLLSNDLPVESENL